MYGPVLVNFTALHPKRYLQPYITLVFLVPFPSNQAPSSSLPIDPARHLRRHAPAGNSFQFGSNSSGWCSTLTVVAISGVGVSVIPVAKVIFNDRDVVWNSMFYSKAQTDRPTRCPIPQIHQNTNFFEDNILRSGVEGPFRCIAHECNRVSQTGNRGGYIIFCIVIALNL